MASALSLVMCMVCVAACHAAVEEHRKLLQQESVLLGSPGLPDAAAEPPAPETLIDPSLGAEASGACRLLQQEAAMALIESHGLSDAAAAEPPAPEMMGGVGPLLPGVNRDSVTGGARRLLQQESVLQGLLEQRGAAAEPPAPEMGTMPGAGGRSAEGGLRKL